MRNLPLLFSLPFIFAATPSAEKTASAIYSEKREAVVLVTTRSKMGSGFFVSGDGLIVTNHHVVEADARPTVKLSNGIELTAETVGGNRDSDVAILQVKGKGFPSIRLSDSDGVESGTRVVVISNPLGLEGSIAEGLVSGIREFGPTGKLIQISAPVSPGSSGGLLCDLRGNALGMVSASLKEGQNLNFAIPSSAILGVLESLKKRPGFDIPLSDPRSNSEKIQKIRRYVATDMAEQAVTEATDYLKGDEFNPAARLLLAEALIKLELYDEAIKNLGIVMKLNPLDTAEATWHLANAHHLRWKKSGNIEDRMVACELFEQYTKKVEKESQTARDGSLSTDEIRRQFERSFHAARAHMTMYELLKRDGQWASEDGTVYEVKEDSSSHSNTTLWISKRSGAGSVEGMPAFLELTWDAEKGGFRGRSVYWVGECQIQTEFLFQTYDCASKIRIFGFAIQEDQSRSVFRDVCRERYTNGLAFLRVDLRRLRDSGSP